VELDSLLKILYIDINIIYVCRSVRNIYKEVCSMKLKVALTSIALLFALVVSGNVFADSESKPFAEKRIVLQITDDDEGKQTLILNVANNLIKHYGPDKVDVEIVAFGPGLKILFDANENKPRIQSLAASGVAFSACNNTLQKMTKKMGKQPVLNEAAKIVPAGVVQIIDRVSQGYILIRP